MKTREEGGLGRASTQKSGRSNQERRQRRPGLIDDAKKREETRGRVCDLSEDLQRSGGLLRQERPGNIDLG